MNYEDLRIRHIAKGEEGGVAGGELEVGQITKREPKISECIFLLPIRLVSPREVTSRIGSKNINSDIFGSL